MRIQIHSSPIKRRVVVSVNYNSQSFMYIIIPKDFSDFLHDNCYKNVNRSLKCLPFHDNWENTEDIKLNS